MDALKDTVEEIKAAALMGDGWEDSLERFAYACGAHGAVLMRNKGDRMLAAITTPEVAEAVRAFAAGRAPPSSRYSRVQYTGVPAFRVDHDDYTGAELARDPFYQEFLRPVGFFWHANVVLTTGNSEMIELSLKRRIESGPYRRADAALLDRMVPDLLVASRLARDTLNAEARGMARLLRQRGGAVFQLDSWGRVLSHDEVPPAGPHDPLRVIGRRLVAADPTAQRGIDEAIAKVLAGHGSGLVPLMSAQDRRCFLQVLPVPGRARDIFLSAAALAVVIESRPVGRRMRLDARMIAEAFGLTDREADVASLLADGLSVFDVARTLRMQTSTARVHLKRIFEKTGTNRQPELVAMLGFLRL